MTPPGRTWRRLRLIAVTALLAAGLAASFLAETGGRLGAVPPASGIAGTDPGALRPPGEVAAFAEANQAPVPTIPSGPAVSIPVLYYHFVRVVSQAKDPLGFALSVTPAMFAAQMELLHERGVHVMSMDELTTDLHAGRRPAARSVVLTFDDGFASFATDAVPILLRYGFPATDFVVSGFVGHPGYMTADQVRLVRQLGFTIGAHTVHHVPLTHVAPSVAFWEMATSRSALQALLGVPVLDFAYPYGAVDPTVAELAQAAGFRDAFTTYGGDAQSWNARYWMRRMEITGYVGLGVFAQMLGLAPPPPGFHAPGFPAPPQPPAPPAAAAAPVSSRGGR